MLWRLPQDRTRMFMKHTWKYLFEDRIYIRGLEYYYSGFVDRIRKTQHGYQATVHGSRDYTVEITETNGRVREMSCTCPYARNGRHCKHSAAVLYTLDEEERSELTGQSQSTELRGF